MAIWNVRPRPVQQTKSVETSRSIFAVSQLRTWQKYLIWRLEGVGGNWDAVRHSVLPIGKSFVHKAAGSRCRRVNAVNESLKGQWETFDAFFSKILSFLYIFINNTGRVIVWCWKVTFADDYYTAVYNIIPTAERLISSKIYFALVIKSSHGIDAINIYIDGGSSLANENGSPAVYSYAASSSSVHRDYATAGVVLVTRRACVCVNIYIYIYVLTYDMRVSFFDTLRCITANRPCSVRIYLHYVLRRRIGKKKKKNIYGQKKIK